MCWIKQISKKLLCIHVIQYSHLLWLNRHYPTSHLHKTIIIYRLFWVVFHFFLHSIYVQHNVLYVYVSMQYNGLSVIFWILIWKSIYINRILTYIIAASKEYIYSIFIIVFYASTVLKCYQKEENKSIFFHAKRTHIAVPPLGQG